MSAKLHKRFWIGLSILPILAAVLFASVLPVLGAVQVQAESYTARSSNAVGPVAITDAGDPSQTGLATRPNEWTSYASIDLTGVTSIDLRYSNAYAVTSVEIRLNSSGGTLLGTCSLPMTGGWNTFTTIACGITPASGIQTVVLVYKTDCYAYLNWFSTGGSSTPQPTNTKTNTPTGPTATPTRTNTPAPTTNTPTRTNTPTGPTNTPTRTNTPVPPTATFTAAPPTATPTQTNTPASGVKIEAENYTARSSTNVGAVAITDAGDPSQTGLASRPNEWTSYANVALTGVTSISLRYSNAYAATSVEIRLNSATGTLLGTCSLPLTGGWSNFQTIACGITSTSGSQTVVLVYKTDCYAYLNWFSTGGGGSTPQPTNTNTNTPTGPTNTPTRTNTPAPPTNTPTSTLTRTNTPTGPTPTKTNTPVPPPGGHQIVGYFSQWGFYNPPYHYVKDLETSGHAAKLTIINYAFTNVLNNQCVVGVTQLGVGDAWADYQMGVSAANSVDGVADQAGQPLMGHWNQLKKLKAMHPGLKVVMSIGGWTYSKYFSDAALPANRQAFVASCVDAFIRGNIPLVNGAGGPGAALGVFDGLDIDWEYPAAPGNVGNIVRPEDTQNFTALLAEFRSQLDAQGAIDGKDYLLTIAAPAGEDKYTKIELAPVAQSLDYINLMTYDFHGAWDPITDFLAPLYAASNPPYPPGSIQTKYYSDYAVNAYLASGVPASKLIMGVPFYGRGWQGVPPGPNNNGLYQTTTGGAPAQAGGVNAEAGMDFYRYLKAFETTAGYTKYRHAETRAVWVYSPSAGIWWSYDDPISLGEKMSYVKTKGMAGAMIWELAADTATGELMTAVYNGLQ